MPEKPYYLAYENRYKKVYDAGVERWGHSPDDENIKGTIKKWIGDNRLHGRRIIEFACGEGACGIILSELGCIYHGVDISPTVVEKARKAVSSYPNAKVSLLDMVNGQIPGIYDAAIDIMGLHMLILNKDRERYLKNVIDCLISGAPVLFCHESYRADADTSQTEIESIEQWVEITGDDYQTPKLFEVYQNDKVLEVNIPLLPARAKNREGYINEFTAAGFVVDDFIEMEKNENIIYSASIFAHKPK